MGEPAASPSRHQKAPPPSSPPRPPRRGLGSRPGLVLTGAGVALVAALVAYAVVATRPKPPLVLGPTAPTTLRPGAPAPGFSLPRLGGGPRVSLAALRGRPVVVNFFASWCPDCRAELGAFATSSRRAAARVAFVGVDSNEDDVSLAARLLATAGAHYPVGLDPTTRVAAAYLVTDLPATVFLRPNGTVLGEVYGALSTAALMGWVQRLQAS